MPSAKRHRGCSEDTMDFEKFTEELIAVLFKTKKRAWMIHDGLRRDGGEEHVRKEFGHLMEHFKEGVEDMKCFAEYYREGDSELRMTNEDLKSFACTENLFARMTEVYGRSADVHCKDCSAKHGRKIMHRN